MSAQARLIAVVAGTNPPQVWQKEWGSYPQRAEDLHLFDRSKRGIPALLLVNIAFPATAVDLFVAKVR